MTKRSITKRVVALAAAAMMLVGMVVPTVAMPTPDNGRITVYKYGGNKDSMLQNYTGEKLSDEDVASKITDGGFTPLENAGFTLYAAKTTGPRSIEALNAAMAGDVTKTLKVVGSTIDISGTTPVINFVMSAGSDFPVDTELYEAEKTTDADGKIVFGEDDIPNGHYVLVETDVPAGHKGSIPSLIQLPLANSDGNPHYDIHVYPKNKSTANLVKKDMQDVPKPVENGDVLTFDLKLKFMNTETEPEFAVGSVADLKNGATSYGIARIVEMFSEEFEYVANTLEVYWLDAFGEYSADSKPMATAHYTTSTAPNGNITVDLTAAGIDKAIADNEVGFALVLDAKYVGRPVAGQADKKVVNTMEGLLRPANGTDTTPTPPVGPDPKPTPTPVLDKVYAPTLSIKVNKTAFDTSGPLKDVTFAIATVPVPTEDYDLSLRGNSSIDWEAAGYIVDEDGEPIIAMTNSAGDVYFSNLEGYNDITGAKFYLKEVATAPGYRLKTNTIEVKFETKADYQTSDPQWFNGANWKQNVDILATGNVVNYPLDGPQDPDEPGFSLPLTGGAGTIMFTIAGIVVMLGAATLYLRGRKKEEA